MRRELSTELREQGRGIIGALVVVGLADLYTMETWWHGWQLSVSVLLAYAVAGLAVVLVVTEFVGFRGDDEADGGLELAELPLEFAELVLQSFLAAALVLALFGVVGADTALHVLARLLLVLVVPLGFGAALANALFTGQKEDGRRFPKNLGMYALGAAFLVGPVAPTQEMELMAAHAGWWRLAAVVAASVLAAYLILFELEFQGQSIRVRGRGRLALLGEAAVVYAVALAVGAGLLASYGHLAGRPVEVWVQETVVLGLMGTVGASAAQVVVG